MGRIHLGAKTHCNAVATSKWVPLLITAVHLSGLLGGTLDGWPGPIEHKSDYKKICTD